MFAEIIMNREKMEEDLLRSFNQLSKETNVIYHNYAAANGMSDATFWILYTICYYGEGVTQKTICEEWFYSSQTVNSSLKLLEKKNLIELRLAPGNKKNKQIFLTEEGKDMTNRLIVPVIEAEKLSFDAFDIQELKKMFRLSFEHVKQLEKLVGKISDNSKGEDE